MGPSVGAGFYGAVFGPLPFRLGRNETARFSVWQVMHADDQSQLQQLAQTESREETIKRYRAALLLHPDDPRTHFLLADLLCREANTAEGIEHYRAGLRLAPDSPEALNNLAWILATDADPGRRNGQDAVQMAEKACQLTHRKTAHYLGTLAAAYAEAGRFDQSVLTATEAIGMAVAAGQTDLADTNRKLLDLYRANRPYHQPAIPASNP
jgi:Flp pilus assembly protein TadD